MPFDTPTIVASISLVGATVGAVITGRNASRANRISAQGQQLQWTEQMRSEATSARQDAESARKDAASAEQRAREASRQADEASDQLAKINRELGQVKTITEDLVDWIQRVMQRAAEVEQPALQDPTVIRLLSTINGGPPSLSNPRLRRPD